MKMPSLTPEEQKKFANGVIQVNGKAMNRTALGIIAAYFKLYPNTTFAELKEAFPDSLNPSGPRAPKSIFKPFTDRDFGVVHSLEDIKAEFAKAGLPYEGLFFTEKDEMFKTSDGVTVIVNKLWESNDTLTGENDLENLAKRAAMFGIVVNKFEARTPFARGTYSLDILEPELFAKITGTSKIVEKEVVRETVEKKVIPFWIWIVVGLALLIPLVLWLAGAFKSNPVVVEKEVVKTVTKVDTVVKVDTVYEKELEDIEAKFNSVQFAVGSYEIPEDAKFALYDLAKLMKKQSNIKIKIEGHTSDEGDANFNQQLSEKRAKAVVDFLVSKGIEPSRLSYEGKGSSVPIDKNKKEVNRRSEFILIK
jgi:outer membrane protein OmpA-like peptidoglycan-associated protein